MDERGGPTTRLDVAPVRARGSLAVMQGLVGTVYGLDLVEASSAIYIILPVGVAGVDKVFASATIHLVVVFAGEDLVVAAAALEAVLPVATREAVGPVGPHKRIVTAGTGKDLRQGILPGEERSDHNYHHREQDA